MAKEVTCAAPECSFRIRSDDEGEIVRAVQLHAKNAHNRSLTKEEVLAAAQEAE
jgi:predicted small metal-binding protein